jgi:cold shock CspA family protein
MPEGVVKRWNMLKGFGFITPTDASAVGAAAADIFVHQSALQMDGFRCLCEGEAVRYEVTQEEDGRSRASTVTAPDGAKLKGLWADEPHAVGTVARWRADKGFGFITPQEGGDDVFVHQSAIHAIGYRSLNVGETVEYAVGAEEGSGRLKATKVTAHGGRPVRALCDATGATGQQGARYANAAGLGVPGIFVGANGLGALGGLAGYAPRVVGGGYVGGGVGGGVVGGGYALGYGGYGLAGLPPQHLAAVAAAGGFDYAAVAAQQQIAAASPRVGGYALAAGYPVQAALDGGAAVGAYGGGPQGYATTGLRAGGAFGF